MSGRFEGGGVLAVESREIDPLIAALTLLSVLGQKDAFCAGFDGEVLWMISRLNYLQDRGHQKKTFRRLRRSIVVLKEVVTRLLVTRNQSRKLILRLYYR